MSMLEHWQAYLQTLVHEEAEPPQVRETSKAFYCGAHIMLTELTAAMAKATPVEYITLLQALRDEIDDFVRSVADTGDIPPQCRREPLERNRQ